MGCRKKIMTTCFRMHQIESEVVRAHNWRDIKYNASSVSLQVAINMSERNDVEYPIPAWKSGSAQYFISTFLLRRRMCWMRYVEGTGSFRPSSLDYY